MAVDTFHDYTYTQFPPRLYRRFLETYLRPYLADPSDGRLLDLGCGSGGLLEAVLEMHDGELVGVDISPACLDACRRRPALAQPRVTLLQADAGTLADRPGFAGGFDRLVSYSVLHLMPGDTPSKLRLLARLTRPGAIVAVDALARVPWNRMMFGLVRLLMRTGLWRAALRLLGPVVGPSFPPAFLEELGRMEYLRHLRYQDFLDPGRLRWPEFQTSFELLRLDVVPQDGFFTGRKARLTLRRRAEPVPAAS